MVDKIDRLKEGAKKIEDLAAQLPSAREIKEQAKAEGERRLEETQKKYQPIHERATHQPAQLDTVEDLKALTDAVLVKKQSIPEAQEKTTIYKWDDGYGNIVYLPPSVTMDQVQAVSVRITDQGEKFLELEPQKQQKIRSEFDLSEDKAESVKPFADHLRNQALEKRFQELKAK